MVDIIIKPETPAKEPVLNPPSHEPVAPPPANPRKDGEYHDTCPFDGCLEVDRINKVGGTAPNGEEYLDQSLFSADRRLGGCGELWTRMTRQGADDWRAKTGGVEPKWVTRADTRTLSIPSEKYMSEYDRIFKKGVYAE